MQKYFHTYPHIVIKYNIDDLPKFEEEKFIKQIRQAIGYGLLDIKKMINKGEIKFLNYGIMKEQEKEINNLLHLFEKYMSGKYEILNTMEPV